MTARADRARRLPVKGDRNGQHRHPIAVDHDQRDRPTTPIRAPASYFTQSGVNTPHSAGVTVTQNLLNGFQTVNSTRLAESQVFAVRETLRSIE